MARSDDSASWRGYVALAILGSLVGIHLWVRSLNAPVDPKAVEAAKNAPAPVAIDDIDPSLPPEQRDRLAREKALRRLLDQQTQDLRRQAAVALEQGQYEAAAALYRRVLKMDPENPEAKDGLFRATDERAFTEHFGRGQEALALGDHPAALFEFERALTLKPGDPQATALLTEARFRMLLRDGQRAETQERWEEAARMYEQALAVREDEALRQRVRNLNDTVVVESKKARRKAFFKSGTDAEELERAGRLDEALALYDRLIEEAAEIGEDPERVRRKRAGCAEKYKGYEELHGHMIKKAQEALAAENFTDALQAAERALQYTVKQEETRALVREIENRAIQRDMVEIPAGPCIVGGGTGPGALPQRRVDLKRFYIDRHEVTHRQYQAFLVAANYTPPTYWNGKNHPKGMEDVPVMAIAYEDALAYAKWAKKRLPTEEEWEKAARGSDGRLYPWGNEWQPALANTRELGKVDARAAAALPVPRGSFARGASPYGCFDMAGNAMEWTSTEARAASGDRVTLFRVLKGGSFLFDGRMCQTSARLPENPTLRLMGVGFRCAKDAE